MENAEKKRRHCGIFEGKNIKFGGIQELAKINAAELRSRRDMDRLKGNGKTENLKRPELAANRQKIQKLLLQLIFFLPFSPKKYY